MITNSRGYEEILETVTYKYEYNRKQSNSLFKQS